jgi:hypothetical protein
MVDQKQTRPNAVFDPIWTSLVATAAAFQAVLHGYGKVNQEFLPRVTYIRG